MESQHRRAAERSGLRYRSGLRMPNGIRRSDEPCFNALILCMSFRCGIGRGSARDQVSKSTETSLATNRIYCRH
jgi:hypothetical protein